MTSRSRRRHPSAENDAVGTQDRARATGRPPPPYAAPACHPLSGCVTCSDEGVPMRVLEARPARALAVCIDASGARSEVMTDLVGPVSPGDRLLVHAGTALLALDRETGAGGNP